MTNSLTPERGPRRGRPLSKRPHTEKPIKRPEQLSLPEWNPEDPTESTQSWQWYVDRRLARVMAVLARIHADPYADLDDETAHPPPPRWLPHERAEITSMLEALHDQAQVVDRKHFEAMLRNFFFSSLDCLGLPRDRLPFPSET